LTHGLLFIDLPGYGFAYAKPQKIDSWNDLIKEFFSVRKRIKRIMLLIDSRIGMKESDLEFIDMLEQNKQHYQIVLTKVDRVDQEDLVKRVVIIRKQLESKRNCEKEIMLASAFTKAGMNELREEIYKTVFGGPTSI